MKLKLLLLTMFLFSNFQIFCDHIHYVYVEPAEWSAIRNNLYDLEINNPSEFFSLSVQANKSYYRSIIRENLNRLEDELRRNNGYAFLGILNAALAAGSGCLFTYGNYSPCEYIAVTHHNFYKNYYDYSYNPLWPYEPVRFIRKDHALVGSAVACAIASALCVCTYFVNEDKLPALIARDKRILKLLQ